MHPLWVNYISSNSVNYSNSLEAGADNSLVFLSTMGVLQLHGDGAAEFLQGYVSCDTTKLGPNQALFGALCDIKGRVIASFYLLEIQGSPSFVMRTSTIEPVKNHLEKYLVFARCTLQDVSDDFVVLGRIRTATGESHTNNLPVNHFQGISELGVDVHRQLLVCAPEPAIKLWSATETHVTETFWELADLRAGIIMPGSEISGLHLPQSLNMTGANGAVDFDKGCYLGQEIIARVEHRGSLKRRLAIFSWKSNAKESPEPGEVIFSSAEKTFGQIVHSVEDVPGEGLLAGVVRWPNDEVVADELYTGKAKLTLLQYGGEI